MKTCTKCQKTKPFIDYHRKGNGYHSACKICRNASNRAWNSRSEYKRVRTPNPTKLVGVSYSKKFWRKLYKKRLKQSTPDWVKSDYKDQMKYLYDLRDEVSVLTGEEYHLDHIIPINHPNICGLNVPWNLQVLPAEINLKKGNKWPT